MKTKTFIIAILFLLNLGIVDLFSQITKNAVPVPNGDKNIPAYIVHVKPKLERKLSETRHLKNLEFAEVVEMNITPKTHGEWFKYNDKRVWRQKLISPEAYSINVTFTKFRLEKGVSVLIYNPSKSDVLGGLTYLNNKPDLTLSTRPIQGDTIIIEMQVPLDLGEYGELEIGKLGHDFMNIYDILKDGQYARSGDCNLDVACSEDEDILTSKNSVCRIIFNNRELCTGTIVNNTNQNSKPYVITANHCLSDSSDAQSAVFIFDYESPFCNGPDGSVSKSVSGSTLLATAKKIDFSLVELSEDIPVNYYPYYSGWNATEDREDLTNTYSIHHPWGDVKKLSVDNDPPISESYSAYYEEESHWRIAEWDEGTTERGSSGGPLFDNSNRLIGGLTGGEADCYNPVNDYYAKISKAWDFYSDTIMQLKYWLDPTNTGIKKIDGYDPNYEFMSTFSTVSNFKSGETISIEQINEVSGYYTGHNTYQISQYAEKFESENEVILSGFYLNIAKLSSADPSRSKIKIKLWQGETKPEELVAEKIYLFNQLAENQEMFLEFDHFFNLKGTFYIGYEIFYENLTDTFAVFHTDILEEINNTTTYAYVNGEWDFLAEEFPWKFKSKLSISPYLSGELSSEEIEPGEIVEPILYPNPTSGRDHFTINFQNNLIKLVDLKLYDLNGILILSENFITGDLEHEINLAKFNRGIYLCKIVVNNEQFVKKLVVTK